MPCLPCGARKLSARACSQTSATDAARRTEMELKVDQKVLCGEIKRQEDMWERSAADEELMMEVDAHPLITETMDAIQDMCLKDLKVGLVAEVQLCRKCQTRALQLAEEEKEAEAKFYRLKEQRRAMEGAYNEQKCRASVFAINIRFKEREQGIRKNPFTDVTKDTANQR